MTVRFSDAIHGQIRLPESMEKVLTSKVLARLRNIRQLGLNSVSYPGAVHTRFEHSIGTAAVMQDLLDQFLVTETREREVYIVAALLSEVGIYPLSHNCMPIFKPAGVFKSVRARELYDRFLADDFPLSAKECALVFGEAATRDSKFLKIEAFKSFEKLLTFVNLASRIDYVLRDGHFSGRYRDIFDYRYFRSLNPEGRYDEKEELKESVFELHRAIHALNAVYGDPLRRFLTQVLIRLVDRLTKRNLFEIGALIPLEVYVDLDDDQFISYLGSCVENASRKGDSISKRMFNIVARSVQPEVRDWRINLGEENLTAKKLEMLIAKDINVENDAVFVLVEPHVTEVGFRLFGKDYGSYSQAITSDDFLKLTGLREASDKPCLKQGDAIRYHVV